MGIKIYVYTSTVRDKVTYDTAPSSGVQLWWSLLFDPRREEILEELGI